MQACAMKHSSKKSSDQLWQEAQNRAKQHAQKTGIPFHLWLLHSQKVLPFPTPPSPDPTTDLHRAFRDELLS